MPRLQYQTPRKRNNEPCTKPPKSTFLHFGLYSDNSESLVKLSPDFDGEIRLYINPPVEDTPEVAALLCKGFIREHGYMPTGKFREDVTSSWVEERNDRLLFWLKSPQELTTVLRSIYSMQQANPNLFKNRQPIVLGDPVMLKGKELTGVRIAQEPHQNAADRVSFSEHCRVLLNLTINEVFQGKLPSHPLTEESINKFVGTLRGNASDFRRNPASFSFNEKQDMRIINSAIKAAESPKKYSF